MVIRSALFAVLALICVASCGPSNQAPVPMKTEVYDGLRFSIPVDRRVTRRGDALSIGKIDTYSHRDMTIRIWIDQPAPLPDDRMKKREKPALHLYGESSGGMGGPEYYISIPKRVGGRDVLVRGLVQLEYGKPNFDTVWAIWESLEVATEDAVEAED